MSKKVKVRALAARLVTCMTIKHVGGVLARKTATLVAAFLAGAAPIAAGTDAKSFDWVRSNLAIDPQGAMLVLDELARDGDPQAQWMLGTMLMEGKTVPQDKVLGLAFMQVVAESQWGSWTKETQSELAAVVQRYQLQMSGSELIHADTLTNAIQIQAVMAHLGPYTSQRLIGVNGFLTFETEPVQINVPPVVAPGQIMRLGCAAKRLAGCDRVPDPGTEGHCTGRIPRPDAVTSKGIVLEQIPYPSIPDELRYSDFNTNAVLLTHLDSGGAVCSTILIRSSGNAVLDKLALDSIARSTRNPPTKAGVPTEGLFVTGFTFRVR